MSKTYAIRKKLIDIARLDAGKVEVSKNTAPWIAKLWPATNYPTGMKERQPYCAAGLAYCLREWLKLPEVLKSLNMTPEQAEAWRCKSASVKNFKPSNWRKWARDKGLIVLPRASILKTGDIVIYNYSHIELVTDDDGTTTGPFTAIGYNTDAAGSRDGEGCFEKPRSRAKVLEFIRILE